MPLNAMRFDAKCSAFWRKMQCVLVQNAMRFGAKRSAKWCLMQVKKHKYPLQWYK